MRIKNNEKTVTPDFERRFTHRRFVISSLSHFMRGCVIKGSDKGICCVAHYSEIIWLYFYQLIMEDHDVGTCVPITQSVSQNASVAM